MTITTTQNIVRYSGNGATTTWAYSFLIPESGDEVITFTAVDGTETVLAGGLYSITGLGSENGGIVTYPLSGSPIANGTRLTIQRVLPVVQETDLENQDGFYPATVESALDYLTMLIQQFNGSLDNVIRVPISDPTPDDLPTATVRALQTFIFDADGNPTVGLPSGTANVSAAMQAVVAASTLLAGRIAIGLNLVTFQGTYGAKGDGVTNDTVALMQADADEAFLLVEPGTYVIDNCTLDGLRGMICLGDVTFIPSSNVPTGGTSAFLLLFRAPSVFVQGLTIVAAKATYPNLKGLAAALPAANVVFVENTVIGCGFPIYEANVSNFYSIRNSVRLYGSRGITFEGASSGNVNALFNVIDGTGSSSHGISSQFGSQFTALGNYISSAGFFGIGVNTMINVIIGLNRIFNSVHESWNTEDCEVINITNNLSYWDVGVSTDYGGSIFGNTVSNAYGAIVGNVLVNAAAAAIGMEGPATGGLTGFTVTGNVGLNCCRSFSQGGIRMTGSANAGNFVHHNTLINSAGTTMIYGVEEFNSGGLPVLNRIEDNFVIGATTKQVLHINALAPAALTVNTDNYAPTNGQYYDFWIIGATGAVNLTGIANGFAGARLNLYNNTAFTITMKNNATSSAGNRFFFGADFSLAAGISLAIAWNSEVNGWIKD